MPDGVPSPQLVALVTGGGRGIGRATSMRLAERGATVIIGYNSDAAAAAALARELPGQGHLALPIPLGNTAAIEDAAATVASRFGRLDVLVNNGGATTPVPAEDLDGLSDALFDETVTINLRGPFAVIRAFRPLLDGSQRAVIVNVSSLAAQTGTGSSLAYSAAKAGLNGLTIALAKALAPRIRVLAVAPGGVDTGFVRGRRREDFEAMASRTPLGKLTTPDDVARAILACITELTSSTGIIVPVDEGRHL